MTYRRMTDAERAASAKERARVASMRAEQARQMGCDGEADRLRDEADDLDARARDR